MRTTSWSAVLSSRTVASVPVLQVAGDGRWETAGTVPLAADPTRLVACIEQVVATPEHDVAVEVLWPGQIFVGARWDLAEADEALMSAQRVQAALVTPMRPPVEAALLALLDTTSSPAPEFAELGAVNAWASTGPLTLWRRGEVLAPGAVDEALASRPDLTECRHAVAVELAAVDPRPCWIGVTVSTFTGYNHRLNRDALGEVLARGTETSR